MEYGGELLGDAALVFFKRGQGEDEVD